MKEFSQHTKDKDLSDMWMVTYEMIIKEDIESIIVQYHGLQQNDQTINALKKDIQKNLKRLLPENYRIDLGYTAYVLDSVEVIVKYELSFIDVTLIPNFIESNFMKTMFDFKWH